MFAIEELDHGVGHVVTELVTLGLANDTYLVFARDNGPWFRKGPDGGPSSVAKPHIAKWDDIGVERLLRYDIEHDTDETKDVAGDHPRVVESLVEVADGAREAGAWWPAETPTTSRRRSSNR